MESCKITVVIPEKIGTISPEIYGHFVEHIGGVIYDGIWVGKNSSVPNINGFRKDLVEKFRAIQPSVLRWGGCFAETYRWRDGIGKNRPVRPSWWNFMDGRYETNEVGTHEFVEFCELVGAKPYFALNITSLTPMDARDWMDYCLSPKGSTALALEREENGRAEPFDIPYWGIGNENWGGGGKMTADEYVNTYRRYAMTVENFSKKVKFIAGVCNPHGYAWARTFFANIEMKTGDPLPLDGASLHHYCSGGDALEFDEKDWDALIKSARKMEEYIKRHRGIIVSHGREEVKLYIDEWGCMHPSGTEVSEEKYLYQQQSTMRDAVVTAYNLNLFNNYCDCVEMANLAQTANCLHSLFLANGEKFTVTPTYHVFDMFKNHQGGACMRTLVEDERVSVSASLSGKMMTVTLANLSCKEDIQIQLDLLGGVGLSSSAVVLSDEDVHAHNTFEDPERVKPRAQQIDLSSGILLPKAGIISLTVELAE